MRLAGYGLWDEVAGDQHIRVGDDVAIKPVFLGFELHHPRGRRCGTPFLCRRVAAGRHQFGTRAENRAARIGIERAEQRLKRDEEGGLLDEPFGSLEPSWQRITPPGGFSLSASMPATSSAAEVPPTSAYACVTPTREVTGRQHLAGKWRWSFLYSGAGTHYPAFLGITAEPRPYANHSHNCAAVADSAGDSGRWRGPSSRTKKQVHQTPMRKKSCSHDFLRRASP